ncbi:TetR/AcrR family transcriptional regulator [Paenibacillus eucommiae]|uniref:AcrR family transcriptional regulator n=1 Tax=Paenibacillus eucommiae TaxID=1355755 RepID=A0ABS4IYS0_9BACL|nr:TetR/AcrR family transcriptional regulator [Paenibacillus eucommiae]MBP1992735.1 AcrR family transcriptional regulator [Paenibacillus eucommiae]
MTNPNNTYQDILEAAYKLVAELGIDKTSLSMIASEVGISKPAIYYHFSSKEVLIDFLFEETFKNYNFSAYFSIEEYTQQNFEQLLISNGLQMLPKEDEAFNVLRVLNEFLLAVSRKEKYHQRLIKIQEDFLSGFSDLLTRGAALGVISPDNTVAKAHMLSLVIDNISNFMLMGIKLDYKDIWMTTVKSVILNN